MKNIGRKLVGILILFSILTGSSVSCQREKKTAVTPQNKILFTAKQSGVMNVVKIDLTTKVKKNLSVIPFCPVNTYGSGENGIQLSPDKKKFAFQVVRKIKDISLYDIYTMNIDGTSLKQTTKDIKIQNNHNFESLYLKFSFSPDSQFLIIYSYFRNKDEDKVIKMKLYVANINGTNVEEFEEENPLFHIYFFFLFSENKKLETIKSNTADFEYFISYEKSIGIFSWKTRKYSPIFKFNETIASCLPSLDQKHILFKVYKPNPHLEALYDYNIALKSATKLIESSTSITNMLWLWNTEQILYSKETGKVIEHGIRLEQIYLYDIASLKSELICNSGQVELLEYLYEKKILVHALGIDGYYLKLINMESKKEESIPRFNLDIFINKTDLIDFNNEGFSIYDTKAKVTKVEKKDWSYDDQIEVRSFKISPDGRKFYFVSKNDMYFYDTSGKKILVHRLSYNGFPYQFPYLAGLFISPSEIVYLEFGNNKTDLFQYDLLSKKSTNLTQELGYVRLFQTSPDQKQVAVMTIDAIENMYSVDIVDLKQQEEPKRVSSLPEPNQYTDNFNPLEDKTLLYSLGWSTDSKKLYFVSAVPPEEEEENVFGNLAIYQVNSDGSNVKPLTDLRFSSYQANLSPNRKQMVYVYELEQELTVAKVDKTSIEKLASSQEFLYCFRPIWSPNSKMISVYQTNSSQNGCHFLILDEKKEIRKEVPVTTTNFYLMIEQLKTENFFSADSKFVAFIKNYQHISNQSTLVLLKNMKEEILLKGNNIDFRWSPTGNQLLLLESKEKNQINQLTLYDCSTKTYTTIIQDVQQLFDACWSPDGKQILYAGTDSKSGQIIFKTSNPDGSNQKVLFTFGENPLERPNSIEKIEKLVWLR